MGRKGRGRRGREQRVPSQWYQIHSAQQPDSMPTTSLMVQSSSWGSEAMDGAVGEGPRRKKEGKRNDPSISIFSLFFYVFNLLFIHIVFIMILIQKVMVNGRV